MKCHTGVNINVYIYGHSSPSLPQFHLSLMHRPSVSSMVLGA